MSRGLGKVQRSILDQLQGTGNQWTSIPELCAGIYGRWHTRAQYVSLCRAVMSMQDAGTVEGIFTNPCGWHKVTGEDWHGRGRQWEKRVRLKC